MYPNHYVYERWQNSALFRNILDTRWFINLWSPFLIHRNRIGQTGTVLRLLFTTIMIILALHILNFYFCLKRIQRFTYIIYLWSWNRIEKMVICIQILSKIYKCYFWPRSKFSSKKSKFREKLKTQTFGL